MSAQSRHITLNNGVKMPALRLGVFQTPPAETVGAVQAAIATGYRLIDTAAAYANEREVGEGIRRSAVARDDLFIETPASLRTSTSSTSSSVGRTWPPSTLSKPALAAGQSPTTSPARTTAGRFPKRKGDES
jgi:aryl-alcohol dehydrogenase-like predicted oxidoreductase